MSYKEAQDRFGIQGRSTVLVWLRKHGPQQVPERPEHVWVADITYLSSVDSTLYLSLVTDAYSRKSWVITFMKACMPSR